MNRILTAAALAAMMSTTAASAAESDAKMNPSASPSCTTADIEAAATKAKAVSDANKQKAAMSHVDMARASMTKNDLKGCVGHLTEANAAMATGSPATKTN